MRWPAALIVALVVFAAVPAGAGATSFVPPGNKIFWGGQGGYSEQSIRDFKMQSGRHPAVFNYFISWNASESSFHWLSFRLADARAQKTAAMLSISPEETRLSPR